MAQILVITQQEELAQMFARVLLNYGYEMMLARDYRSAIESAQNRLIEQVIFDPLRDSDAPDIDFLNAIHALNPTLPIIALDSRDERHDRLMTRLKISFTRRPFDVEEVVLRMHRSLNP
jgi:DNA-binding response OmpR family regulator